MLILNAVGLQIRPSGCYSNNMRNNEYEYILSHCKC